tara:strand:- start:900 stop:1046 length:147 start_codon:yes stop_codon:yes gene_type:complete
MISPYATGFDCGAYHDTGAAAILAALLESELSRRSASIDLVALDQGAC